MGNDGDCHNYCEGEEVNDENRYNYTTCAAGQEPAGGVYILPSSGDLSCINPGGCNYWFPSEFSVNTECANNRGSCEINQHCCPIGQNVECGTTVSADDVLPTDTKYDGYAVCPVGTRVGLYANADSPTVYCRANCQCVVPCGERPGTSVDCNNVSMGTYTKLNPPGDYSCAEPYDSASQNDRMISWVNTNQVYREYYQSDDPDCESKSCSYLVQEYYIRLTCEKITRVCTCIDSCNATAAKAQGVIIRACKKHSLTASHS
jgi:hypothetical protein